MNTTPHTRFAPLLLLLVLACVCPRAAASELGDAAVAMQKRDAAQVRALLIPVIEADNVTPAQLQQAALIALQMQDRNLLERVRAVSEGLEIDGAASPELDLALATAYLGLGEHAVRAQTGSTTALFFADAESRARAVLAKGPHDAAAWLAARTRFQVGDLPGALAILKKQKEAGLGPRTQLQYGTLLYERGATRATDTAGKLSPEAAKDLEQAAELTGAVIKRAEGEADLGIHPDVLDRAHLTQAWSNHRLRRHAVAQANYLRAHRLGGKTTALALRGLASLFAHQPEKLAASLKTAATQRPQDPRALDDLIRLHVRQKDPVAALVTIQRRIKAFPKQPEGYRLGGAFFAHLGKWSEAADQYIKALELDASYGLAARGLEQVAQARLQVDFEEAIATYETLLRLRPKDPYSRNNLGFVLRERVTPFTLRGQGNVQTLKADAPPRIRELLFRCRDVYAEAVRLIPESEDDSREMQASWNLAGIVNDYGLMVHYFTDIQDGPLAEHLYLRTLRMTEDGFKDTYSPNLQRLYTFVLPKHELTWYRLARRAKDAILKEQVVDRGLRLVPDLAKRESAATDEIRLRARIVQELGADAAEDGSSWPIEAKEGSGR